MPKTKVKAKAKAKANADFSNYNEEIHDPVNKSISMCANGEWNFYFGRGGGSNRKRQVSKANSLVQDLALRYSYCSQSEKRLFAKNEVYDMVVRNGGTFFLVANKEFIDVTEDVDEAINRIMQCFRDINKNCRTTPASTKASLEGENMPHRTAPTLLNDENNTIQSTYIVQQVLKTRRAHSETTTNKSRSPRPKRRCIRPSVIEPPIIECVRDALRGVDIDTNKSIPRGKIPTSTNDGEMNAPFDAHSGEPRHKSFDETGICFRATDDAFDEIIVEPPRLENSFSQLIMTDEIKAHLPTDSQQSINLNLHSRVQRLEVIMEPQSQCSSHLIVTDVIKAHLPTDSQQSINLKLHFRVQRLENMVGMLVQQKTNDVDEGTDDDDDDETSQVQWRSSDRSQRDGDENNYDLIDAVGESFDAAAGISNEGRARV